MAFRRRAPRQGPGRWRCRELSGHCRRHSTVNSIRSAVEVASFGLLALSGCGGTQAGESSATEVAPSEQAPPPLVAESQAVVGPVVSEAEVRRIDTAMYAEHHGLSVQEADTQIRQREELQTVLDDAESEKGYADSWIDRSDGFRMFIAFSGRVPEDFAHPGHLEGARCVVERLLGTRERVSVARVSFVGSSSPRTSGRRSDRMLKWSVGVRLSTYRSTPPEIAVRLLCRRVRDGREHVERRVRTSRLMERSYSHNGYVRYVDDKRSALETAA